MPTLTPEHGLVIRFDYLWQHENDSGMNAGAKDRPCAVVVIVQATDRIPIRQVYVCPITHSHPENHAMAVAIPAKVRAHLGLDNEQSWIRTDTMNRITWPADQVPPGVTKARATDWAFGYLPPKLYDRIKVQVLRHVAEGRAALIDRPFPSA